MRRSPFRTMLFAVAAFGLTEIATGVSAMAKPDIQLGWQWPADRALTQAAVLKLNLVKKEGGGLFGLRRAPSLGGHLPDGHKVEGSVMLVDRPGPLVGGQKIGFRIPEIELKGAGKDDTVAIGIIGDYVVCLAPTPRPMDEKALEDWLHSAPCGD